MVGGSGGFDYIIMLSFSFYSISLLFNCYIVILLHYIIIVFCVIVLVVSDQASRSFHE